MYGLHFLDTNGESTEEGAGADICINSILALFVLNPYFSNIFLDSLINKGRYCNCFYVDFTLI